MTGKADIHSGLARMIGAASGAAFIMALTLGAPGAVAQDKKATPKAAAPAAAAPAAGGAAAAPAAEQVMWVKLCEKAPVMTKDKDGKDVREEKGICLTHHERLDGNTGMVLVSAAIRQVEGAEKQHLMVMVPLGMALQPGLRASVYSKELWEKAQKNEKIDDTKLTPMKLNFTLCHPAGCTAEIELTPDILAQLKANAGLMVFSINGNGQVIAFPVPLTGFGSAIDGKPADNQLYMNERRKLMEQIAQRQQVAFEEYKKQQEAEAAKGGKGATPAAAATGSAPAEKKK